MNERTERKIIGLIGAVQFVNVLDFMMVMPMGPDFAAALGIPTSRLGWVGGSYTAAASVAGLLGSAFLDRFDRRKALLVSMLGLVLGTVAGGLATNLATLVAARVIAGAFGGPATSVALSIVADVVPVSRRGRAMGAVMGAFSLASILGVPAGLELARIGDWRTPFFAVGGLALAVTLAAVALLPPLRSHLALQKPQAPGAPEARGSALAMLKRSEVQLAYLTVFLAMLGAFMMIPNMPAYFQFNLGFPRERLGLLYLIGGVASFLAMRVAGRLIDRFNAFGVAVGATAVLCGVLYFGYALYPPPLSSPVIFVGFMLGMSIRGVAANSLASRVPRAPERARFMSLQSAVNHCASAAGAFYAAAILTEGPGKRLEGMSRLALISMALAVGIPLVMRQVEARVRKNESSGPVALGAEV